MSTNLPGSLTQADAVQLGNDVAHALGAIESEWVENGVHPETFRRELHGILTRMAAALGPQKGEP